MSDRIIHLEPVDSSSHDDGPLAFTDVIVVVYLEGLPAHDHDGDVFYESDPLGEAVAGAFALGCAVGVDFPDRIVPVLEQTHPGQVTEIIDECREPLELQVAAARQTTDPLEPADFIGDMLQAIEEASHADIETAQNALSMSFEYGLILAHVQRSAALVLRNAFNRAQEKAAQEEEPEDEPADAEDEDLSPEYAPFESLQELAQEIMSAYEADIGFA